MIHAESKVVITRYSKIKVISPGTDRVVRCASICASDHNNSGYSTTCPSYLVAPVAVVSLRKGRTGSSRTVKCSSIWIWSRSGKHGICVAHGHLIEWIFPVKRWNVSRITSATRRAIPIRRRSSRTSPLGSSNSQQRRQDANPLRHHRHHHPLMSRRMTHSQSMPAEAWNDERTFCWR